MPRRRRSLAVARPPRIEASQDRALPGARPPRIAPAGARLPPRRGPSQQGRRIHPLIVAPVVKLWMVRSRLYRSRLLQYSKLSLKSIVCSDILFNVSFATFFEIYKIFTRLHLLFQFQFLYNFKIVAVFISFLTISQIFSELFWTLQILDHDIS